MLRKIVHVWIFLTFAAAASAQTQSLFFTPPVLSASGGISAGAAAVDLNGDGKLDVVYPDGTVWLSKADGAYQTGTAWCTTGQAYCGTSNVQAADFNHDGKVDLVVATSNFVWVALGNGDGTFQAAVSSVTRGGAPLFVADVNGDSKPDVLVSTTNGFSVCLGRGDGTFQAAIVGPNLPAMLIVGLADFNGDHKVDLLARTTNTAASGQISVFTGNGDGTFANAAIATNLTLPDGSSSLFDFQIADLSGDGKPDVVVSQYPLPSLGADPFDPTAPGQATFVALGKGDGTFANATQIADRGGLISVGDINGDGVADLLLQGPSLDVLLGTGGGGVALKESYFVNSVATRTIVADFNGDGKADVFSGGVLFFGNGDGTLKGNFVSYFAGSPVALADFDQDGKADLVVPGNGNTVNILLGDGTGRFTPGFASPVISTQMGLSSIKVADLNGDGKSDLVVAESTQGPSSWAVYVLLGNGDGTFNAPVAVAQSSQFFLVSADLADVNNDHKLDLMVSDSSGAINVFLGNGDGSFTASNSFFEGVTTAGVTSGAAFVTGDFNGDGKVDLVVTAANGLNFVPGKGDGTFGTAVPATSLIAGGVTAVADFNGDGILDLCGTNVVVLGNGDGTFKAGSTIANTVQPVTYSIAADLNGDGKTDLVGSSTTRNGVQVLQYALGNGDGTFTPVILEQTLSNIGFNTGVVGDVNGDGRPDIVFGYQSEIVSLLNTQPPATPDFSETVTSPSSSTVSAGQTATFGFNVAPMAGFQQTVSFTCSGAPTNSTCTVSPTSVMVNGSAPTAVKVTVTTTSGSLVLPMSFHSSPKGLQWPVAPIVVTALLVILFAMATPLVWSQRKLTATRVRWATAGCGLILVAPSLLLTSCGGGMGQTSSQANSGTANGSYTIKVTGTSGSGASAVSHSVTFTLTVQ